MNKGSLTRHGAGKPWQREHLCMDHPLQPPWPVGRRTMVLTLTREDTSHVGILSPACKKKKKVFPCPRNNTAKYAQGICPSQPTLQGKDTPQSLPHLGKGYFSHSSCLWLFCLTQGGRVLKLEKRKYLWRSQAYQNTDCSGPSQTASPVHLATKPPRLQYSKCGLQFKELQDTESLWGGLLREAQSNRGRKNKKLVEFEASSIYTFRMH